MFIYSLRASTLKFFAVVCVALVTMITLIAFVPTYGEGTVDIETSGAVEISYHKVVLSAFGSVFSSIFYLDLGLFSVQ